MSPIKATLSRPAKATEPPPIAPTKDEGNADIEAPSTRATSLTAEVDLGEKTPLGPWVVLGSGGALLVAGGVTTALALGAQGDYEDYVDTIPEALPSEDMRSEYYDETQRLSAKRDMYTTMSGVLLGVGVGAAVGGLVWMLMTPEDTPAEVSLSPLPGGLSAHAQWRF